MFSSRFAFFFCIQILLVCVSFDVYSDDTNVVLSCKVADEWIQRVVELSPLDPPPSVKVLIEHLKSGGMYEIEASFDTARTGDGFGLGSLMSHPMPYWITERHVIFMTADEDGGENSLLNRYTGMLELNLRPTVIYQCESVERKY